MLSVSTVSILDHRHAIEHFFQDAFVASEKFLVEHVKEPLSEMYATIRYDEHQFSFSNELYVSFVRSAPRCSLSLSLSLSLSGNDVNVFSLLWACY